MSKLHHLKCVDPYFTDVWEGRKTFEIRRNDRDYQIGDVVILQRYDPRLSTWLSGVIVAKVGYVLEHAEAFGVAKGYVVLSLYGITRGRLDDGQ